jgi:hypothetical protein
MGPYEFREIYNEQDKCEIPFEWRIRFAGLLTSKREGSRGC